MGELIEQKNRVQNLVELPPPALDLLGRLSYVHKNLILLNLLLSAELQRTNSSPISNCRRSKSAIFFRAI